MAVWFILLTIGAYLLGSVPTAYLVAKWRRGIDIRQYGSGNVGASNVLAVISRRWSVAVTVFDIGKGALAVSLAEWLGFGVAQQATAGVAAIIGHNWPVFLNFRGGRGLFTSLGVIATLSPQLGGVAVVLVYLFAPFRQMSVGVIITLSILPLLSWFLSQPLGVKEPLPITLGFTAILLLALTRRFTAPRSPISASVPTRELFTNRLFFDRDIRDRDTWIHQGRQPPDQPESPR
ncbi:MAG: glycerol-3-phosphate acyltransferase [Dehalococcoidales bacterium]|nr:glycerol-3-phosphate acyltransferase [Dehalococcoidales bacterium]